MRRRWVYLVVPVFVFTVACPNREKPAGDTSGSSGTVSTTVAGDTASTTSGGTPAPPDATATFEGGTLPVAGKFPPAGVDIVTHRLQLGIQRVTPGASGKLPDKCETAESVGATVEELERIDFSGRMILRREPVVKVGGANGRDRQNFKVLAWAASGYSKKLNVAIQYVLSPESEAPQPMSSIISEKEGPGFPVAFNFNLVFDAYANGRLVESRHHGAPEGHGFQSIPPGPDAPRLTKFESCFVQMPDPSKPGSLLRFFPIECKDQHAETVQVLAGS